MLPILFRVSIASQPGQRWSYSNVGYYLLGMIIEKVTGESYEAFLKHRIFEPLQMTETRRMDRKAIIPQRASGSTLGGQSPSQCQIHERDVGVFRGRTRFYSLRSRKS